MAVKLELCVDSLYGVSVAAMTGAARVELNCAIELGGLTPSIGLVEMAVERIELSGHNCEVIAMARSRPGGFGYDRYWLNVMRRDIDRLLEAGVDGIAFGVLDSDGAVHVDDCSELIEPVHAAGKQAVFHRAFDFEPFPFVGLEKLIELGFDRVMTSGGRPTALEGANLIRDLIETADGRIEILPAGGIRSHNVAELVSRTGCTQVHAALRDDKPDGSLRSNPAIELNSTPPAGGRFNATDSKAVEAMVEALKEL